MGISAVSKIFLSCLLLLGILATGCRETQQSDTKKLSPSPVTSESYPPEPNLPSWEGTVGYLGEHSEYKDYFITLIDRETFGVKGASTEIEKQIIKLRDGDVVKIWGRLIKPADDFSDRQIVVEETRTKYKIDEADPDDINHLQVKLLEYAILDKPLDKTVKERFPDAGLIHYYKSKVVILNDKNLYGKMKITIPNKKLVILSEKQIKQRANEQGDYLALEFDEVISRGNVISISLDLSWIVSDKSKESYLSGGGVRAVFEKIRGRWVLSKPLEGWIS